MFSAKVPLRLQDSMTGSPVAYVITMTTLTKTDANIPVFVYDARKRFFVETFPIDVHYCNDAEYLFSDAE